MSRYPAIEVEHLDKTFRLPRQRIHTFKERALHPFRRIDQDEHRVLRDISFNIRKGEFFGVVGRNGSGKSTLLKCLAGIYRADSGRIAIAGTLAPFIELGVGFNPDLTSRDNVVINAVMMGLTPREARRRFDAVIDFAELHDFVDLKLKNYSSGMMVRLAFAVMVQADTDIMLIDEVLAVGDAAFQQKCLDVFYRLRGRGKTIVLVTHDMSAVERFCHRAMLIDGGEIAREGDAGEVGRAYLELNFQSQSDAASQQAGEEVAPRALMHEVWLADDSGERVHSYGDHERIHIHAVLETHATIESPHVLLWLQTPESTRVFGAGTSSVLDEALPPGERLHMHVSMANPLAPNHYTVGFSLTSGSERNDVVAWTDNAADFVVHSVGKFEGLVAIDHEVTLERGPAPVIEEALSPAEGKR